MRGKRVWMAVGLFGLTFLVLLASTGVALADREPGALKGHFGIAEPRAGDRAVYSLALIVQFPALQEGVQQGFAESGYGESGYEGPSGDQGMIFDGGARMIVERDDDRLLPGPDGELMAMSSYITQWSTEAFDMAGWGAFGAFGGYAGYGAGMGGQVEAEPWKVIHAIGGDVQAVTLPADRVGGDLPGRAIASSLGLDGRGLVTIFQAARGPCGFHSDLQGARVELARPVHVDGECPPATSLLGGQVEATDGVDVLASGHDDVQGRRATVYADVKGADHLRLWFAEDVPYPVRMLTQVMDLEGQIKLHILYEMIQFDPGMDSPVEPSPAGALMALRQDWGPDDAGVAHPFPLSAAWQAARDEGSLEQFLAAHPGAQADSARFFHFKDRDVTEERWTFTATDGDAALVFDVTQRTAPPGYGTVPRLPVPLPLAPETTIIVSSQSTSAAGRMPPHRMPAETPAVTPLMERWMDARTGSEQAQSWAFGLCDDCSGSWVAAGNAASVEGNLSYSFLGLRPDGSPAFLEESKGPYVVPGETKPNEYGTAFVPDPSSHAWNDPRDWNVAYAGFGVWTFPEPETTASVSVAAALVGLVAYVLWPFLKALPGVGAVGLFSRIGPDEVMDHPLRSQIVSLVEAEPGLHFQELARRLETGRGTLEHHLRKLVAADIVSAQASQGFTCYFPKGKVDRRIMAAAPVLKSGGARLVLQAISNEPGRAAQDIAATTGLTPSTVNYHLKRLGAVGLVDTVRRGRFTLLTPTAIGQQAIATWSGT